MLRGKYRIPFYMSTDCENLLKKFLVLNPAKRASLETIMKDKWMNQGYVGLVVFFSVRIGVVRVLVKVNLFSESIKFCILTISD